MKHRTRRRLAVIGSRRDPTGYLTTLRNHFGQLLLKRFRRLKYKVRQLVEQENAFGLVANSNPEGCNQYKACGVPRDLDAGGWTVHTVQDPSKQQLERWVKALHGTGNYLRGIVHGEHVYVFEAHGEGGEENKHEHVFRALGGQGTSDWRDHFAVADDGTGHDPQVSPYVPKHQLRGTALTDWAGEQGLTVNTDQPRDEKGRFSTWDRPDVSGWVSAAGEHIPLEPEDRGHHIEAIRRAAPDKLDTFPYIIEQHGYSRLRQEVPGDTLHVETHHTQYDRVRRIVEGNVDPQRIKHVHYTIYTSRPFERPREVTRDLTDNRGHTAAQIDRLAERIEQPTEAQAEAGNYRMAHVTVHGLPVTLETPRGRERHDTPLAAHYGYIKRTEGSDGDHVDCFVGPDLDAPDVYIVDQVRQDGAWDEHKCMLGFRSREAAVAAYLGSYPPGWRLGPVTKITVDAFKAWLRSGDTSKPVANSSVVSDGMERLMRSLPDVRQRDHFSCGAAAAMSVGRYYGVGPKTLEEWKTTLGTDVEESTSPSAIVGYLRSLGLQVEAREGMAVSDLHDYASRGWPVVCCVQDYGPRVPARARFAYGHYLVVVGVAGGLVVCQDPSEDNVVAGGDSGSLAKTGSIQRPGRIVVDAADWDRVWHDEDADGVKYVRYGVAVGPSAERYWEVRNAETDRRMDLVVNCGGVGGKPGPCVSHVVEALKSAGAQVEHMEQVSKQYVSDKVGQAVSRLPGPVQATVRGTYYAVRLGTKAAFVGWTAGQAFAERVAHEKGLNDEQARRLRGVLGGLDMATFKPISLAGATPALIAGLVPPATASYLAYSTARDPMATWRAAKGAVRDAAVHLSPQASMAIVGNAGPIDTLLDRLDAHGYDDWYIALLAVGLEQHGDLGAALALADRALTTNASYAFHDDPAKVERFQDELRKMFGDELEDEQLWQRYIDTGYRRGAAKTWDAVHGRRWKPRSGDFYEGSKQQFLESSFRQPPSVERVKLLAGRAFDELQGVTAAMSTRMSRVLTDGLVQGQSAKAIADGLDEELNLGYQRSLLVSRTELTRSAAEGQLDAMENLGVDELGVDVEWSTSGVEDRVCERCAALEGAVLTVAEARGLVPLHPD